MKLNLRDLFWLIFVSAVVTMWWIDRSKLADRLSFYEQPKPPYTSLPTPVPPPLAAPLPYQVPEQEVPFGLPLPVEDPFAQPKAAPAPSADPFG